MEFFQNNTLLYNITAGIVTLVLFLLVLKFVESLAKTLFIFIGVVIVGYGLIRFFPNVTEPVTKFITSSWKNSEKSSDDDGTHSEIDPYAGNRFYSEDPTYGDSIYDNHSIYDNSYIYDDVKTYDNDVNTYDNNTYNSSDNYENNDTYNDDGSTYDDSHNSYENDNYYDYNYENGY